MTNAQKWVSIVLVLFILLLALSKLTNKDESSSDSYYTEESANSAETKEIDAEKLIATNRCATCHGRDLNGSGMGPSLINLSANWEKASLVSYLQNPSAFLNNPRMAALKDRFGRDMPAVKNMTTEELNAVVEFILKLK